MSITCHFAYHATGHATIIAARYYAMLTLLLPLLRFSRDAACLRRDYADAATLPALFRYHF